MDDGTPPIAGARHERIQVGEVALHAVRAGEGPLVVLLHGFPEFWWSWRHQLPALAAAGFEAVAPDLRGYGLSDRPAQVSAYALSRLAADVVGLVRACGATRATIVGHDWGGAVAWRVAERHPEVVERLVIVNSPHPVALLRGLRRPDQLVRSSYMLLFQLPVLPERLLAARDHALLRAALRATRATPPSAAELDPYVAAAARADELRGPIHYYRAMGRALVASALPGRAPRERAPRAATPRRVEAPVLVLWGERDPALGNHLATPPPELVPRARVVRLPAAGHTAQLDAPGEVSRVLVEFLREGARVG
jgi:pimeloyl-ACP methyl ester carboxylesterase